MDLRRTLTSMTLAASVALSAACSSTSPKHTGRDRPTPPQNGWERSERRASIVKSPRNEYAVLPSRSALMRAMDMDGINQRWFNNLYDDYAELPAQAVVPTLMKETYIWRFLRSGRIEQADQLSSRYTALRQENQRLKQQLGQALRRAEETAAPAEQATRPFQVPDGAIGIPVGEYIYILEDAYSICFAKQGSMDSNACIEVADIGEESRMRRIRR